MTAGPLVSTGNLCGFDGGMVPRDTVGGLGGGRPDSRLFEISSVQSPVDVIDSFAYLWLSISGWQLMPDGGDVTAGRPLTSRRGDWAELSAISVALHLPCKYA